MAIADAITPLVKAELETRFYQSNLWPSIADDQSAQLPYNDQLVFVSDATDYSLGEQTRAEFQSATASNHARGTPNVATTGEVTGTVDQYKDIDILVTNAVMYQVRPNVLQRVMSDAARAFENDFNNHVRSIFNAAPTGSKLADVSTSAANWGNAAHLGMIRERFFDAMEALDYAHVPREGRVAVVSPAVYRLILEKLEADKVPYAQAPVIDGATVMGQVFMLNGFEVLSDDSMPAGTTASDDANHTMYFMARGIGLSYARQFRDIQTIWSEQYRGWRTMGVHGYMAVLNQPSYTRIAQHKIS